VLGVFGCVCAITEADNYVEAISALQVAISSAH